MALVHSFEKSGNYLFRHRGQIPVILFILAVPVIYLSGYGGLNANARFWVSIVAIVLSFKGQIVRAWSIGTTPHGTSGRNRNKQVAMSLNTKGIYSMVRHPLYLGNYLMWIGIVVYTFNIYFVIIVSLAYWLYYERIMFAEERFLERKFGQQYLDWSLKVPAFLPAFSKYQKGDIPFSFVSVLRREYSGVLATVLGFFFIDVLRSYFLFGSIDFNRPSSYALGAAAIIALILRTLKHNTKLLNESGRS
jgi:protein-S-isoprenylcysteine O-methyltransferase Ste14